MNKLEASHKIADLPHLLKTIEGLKKSGKSIVHCHGCFDLMHIGHIKYLQSAKRKGDILVVTVTPDRYVKRGPGRPVFNEIHRAEAIAALDCVDYVYINHSPTATETIRMIKPDIYVKGSDFGSVESDPTGRLGQEQKAVKSIGGKLEFTSDEVFSSTKIIKENFDIMPKHIKQFLSDFTKKHDVNEVTKALGNIQKLKVLIVGEPIMDEYNFCHLMQKASKSTTVSTLFQSKEMYAGGALCVANHLAGFVDEVGMVAMLGKELTHENFIRSHLKPNVKLFPCVRDDGPTVTKRRYLEGVFMQKMFEVCHFNDYPINQATEAKTISLLKKLFPKYDMVIAADFGHGFITPNIVKLLCTKAPYLVAMTQSNSANLGYNLITKYRKADYIVIDHVEMRLACHQQHGEFEPMVKKISKQLHCPNINTTLGHEGTLIYSHGKFSRAPALSWKVIDTIGAGDAVLALTSPLTFLDVDPEIVAFIGNCAGALAVQYLGNKETIDYGDLTKLIQSFLK
ncbi:MAG: hypothetical protein A2297_05380 [Elusimicrobia bacterium RIFOXYB2_FULL_48_7]|nr:MAG: hypothetical protein A2297_05380 [Elusimicrobia bacterium RIFOXYB2_FULL_48_7]